MSCKIRVGIKESCFQIAKEILQKDEKELNSKIRKNWIFFKVTWAEYTNLRKEIHGQNIYINEE